MVSAVSEIERLRRRQQELEQEKAELEEMARKQRDYEQGKREMIAHLGEGIMALEKKEIQTAQLMEIIVATRSRFRTSLEELEKLDEERWPDAQFREELYKALAIVDDARMEYNKALAKIEILESGSSSIMETTRPASPDGGAFMAGITKRNFTDWLKIGFALSLPLIALVVFLALAHLLMSFLHRV